MARRKPPVLLGDVLRRRREERGWGQAEIADRLGVTQQTVSRWENGDSLPRPRRLLEIAELLGLDSSTLHRLAGYLPGSDSDLASGPGGRAFEQVGDLSDSELILLIDRAWREFRRRNETS